MRRIFRFRRLLAAGRWAAGPLAARRIARSGNVLLTANGQRPTANGYRLTANGQRLPTLVYRREHVTRGPTPNFNVDETSAGKDSNMPRTFQLLLTENVDNLGIVGDVVDVKAGYARNYLLPRGLAQEPTEEAIKALAKRREEVQKEMARIRASQEKMIEKLGEFELTMERSANEQGVLFGGVSQHDIAEALQADGFDVEDRYVRIGEQIKRLDTYTIPIHISHELKAEIKLWVVSDKPPVDLDELVEAEQGDDTADEAAEAAESTDETVQAEAETTEA